MHRGISASVLFISYLACLLMTVDNFPGIATTLAPDRATAPSVVDRDRVLVLAGSDGGRKFMNAPASLVGYNQSRPATAPGVSQSALRSPLALSEGNSDRPQVFH